MSVKATKTHAGKAKKKSKKIGKSFEVDIDDQKIISKSVDSLPKTPVKGHYYTTTKYNSKLGKKVRTTFEATGKTGFGKWKIRRTEHLKTRSPKRKKS